MPGFFENALGEPLRQRVIPSGGNVEDLKSGPRADTFRVGSTAKRAVLFGRGIGLHLENEHGDLFDTSLLRGQVPLSVTAGHAEPSRQKQHRTSLERRPTHEPDRDRHSKWAMNLMAVTLGRKQ